MPEVRTYTVYRIDELSEDAKDKAREWYRQYLFQDEIDWEFVYDYAVRAAEILGIWIDTYFVCSRKRPKIWWSGFWHQGDGACFEGYYYYAKDAPAKIREYAPEDKELHRIADELEKLQSQHDFSLEARVRHTGRYYHSRSTTIEVFYGEPGNYVVEDIAEDVRTILRDFMDWIYDQLKKEYEYQCSDEHVDEVLRANDYTFDEHGNRED